MTTSFAPVPSLTDTNNRESGWHGAAELHIKPRRRAGGRIKQRGWSVQNSAVGGVHGSRCRPAHEWHEASTSQDSLATGFPGSGRWRRIRGRRCGPNFISCRWLGSCAPLTISNLSLMGHTIALIASTHCAVGRVNAISWSAGTSGYSTHRRATNSLIRLG